MKVSTYTLVTVGILLASLAYYFQPTIPLLASVIALFSAFLLIRAAKRIGKQKKELKALQKQNKNNKYVSKK
jgi:hypothetical protein